MFRLGDKFIGLAIYQKDGILVTPLPAILREGKFQFKKVIQILQKHSIKKIIIGYPKYLDGSISIQSKKIKNYSKKLKSLIQIPVLLFEENLSTCQVKRQYAKIGKTNKSDKNIDSFFAVEILQNFLQVEEIILKKQKKI